jgi:hypothetical protein
LTTLAERPEEPHRIRVHQSGTGNLHKVTIDGHEVRPLSMTVYLAEDAEHAIATLRLPALVENLEALAVLDIDLTEPFPDASPLEEC